MIIHPEYGTEGLNHDIALMKLVSPVDLSTYTPACLAEEGVDWTGETAWTYGWGTIEEGASSISNVLMETNVTIVSNEDCNSREGMEGQVTDDMVCAEWPGRDACQGDSGGPFSVEVDGKHVLVGAVSWGYGCARVSSILHCSLTTLQEGLPGVYSRVGYHRQWIDDTMAKYGGANFCANT